MDIVVYGRYLPANTAQVRAYIDNSHRYVSLRQSTHTGDNLWRLVVRNVDWGWHDVRVQYRGADDNDWTPMVPVLACRTVKMHCLDEAVGVGQPPQPLGR